MQSQPGEKKPCQKVVTSCLHFPNKPLSLFSSLSVSPSLFPSLSRFTILEREETGFTDVCEAKSSQYFVGALVSGRETWAFYMLPLPTHSSHDPAPRCELRISRNSVWLSIKNWLLLPKLTPRLVNQMPVCSFKMRDLLLPRDPGCIFPPSWVSWC